MLFQFDGLVNINS